MDTTNDSLESTFMFNDDDDGHDRFAINGTLDGANGYGSFAREVRPETILPPIADCCITAETALRSQAGTTWTLSFRVAHR